MNQNKLASCYEMQLEENTDICSRKSWIEKGKLDNCRIGFDKLQL